MKPLVIAAIGAAVVVVPLAAVGSVFIVGWAIEGRSRRRAQRLIPTGTKAAIR